MLRKNFMKRLSKSASDLSGCKKKSHSTSPEEEQKDAPFATPTHASDDEACEDRVRPSSAASTRSVPEEAYTKKAKKNKKKKDQPSEVGIRTVGGQIHSVYRGHQVNNVSLLGSGSINKSFIDRPGTQYRHYYVKEIRNFHFFKAKISDHQPNKLFVDL